MGYCRSRWYSRVKKLQSSCPWVVSGLRWRWCCFRRTSSHSNSASNKKERERDKSNIAAPASNGTKHLASLIILLIYLAGQWSLGYAGWSCSAVGIRIGVCYLFAIAARGRFLKLATLSGGKLFACYISASSSVSKTFVSVLNYSDFFTFMSSKWLKCGERLRHMYNKCVVMDNK